MMAKTLNEDERKFHRHITERLTLLRTRLEGMDDDDRAHAATRARIQELKLLHTHLEATTNE